MLSIVIDSIPYVIGLVFLGAIVLAYRDAQKFKRIERLNRLLYDDQREPDRK